MIKSILQRFVKGWTSDVELSQQEADTVRDMNNMRIMAENKNSASVQSILGTVESFELNPNYFPIGWCKIANQVVILSTNDIAGVDTNGEIGIATIDPITLVGTYTPMYNHQGLAFNAAYQIECRGYNENESKRRVYWTDDYNPFRALNLLDSRLTTSILVGALVVADEYMCVRGSVTNGTSTYGPNEASGTVFIADGTEVYNTVTTRVIEYLDISLLDVVPTRDQGNIWFNKWLLNGSLLGGGYQYCYQLQTIDGIVSNYSYITKVFHVGDPTVPSSSSVNYQALQGSATNEDSQKGIRITIDNIDQNFDVIRVVAIRSIGATATDTPAVIFEGNITGSQMDFDHFGTEQLGTVPVEDIAAVILAIKTVNTLDILKQKMFIGNVTLADYVPFDTTGITLTPIEYLYQIDKTGRPDDSGDSTTAGIFAPGYAPETGLTVIDTDQWYEVVTTPVSYNGGPALNVGDTFQGVTTVHTYVGAGTVRAVTKIRKYTGEYRILPVRDDYVDTKNAGVATVLKSHWREEVYRYGILIFDIFQNPQYVHWIQDWECPSVYATTDPNTGAPLTFNPRLTEQYTGDYSGGTLASTSARSIGINFSNIDFTPVAAALGVPLSDLDKYIGGWSIVRAKRDAQILGQGILTPSVLTGTDVNPMGPPYLTADYYFMNGGARCSNSYLWHSPDMLFFPFSVQDGDYLKVVDYIEDTEKAFVGGTLDTSNYHYYDKCFESVAAPAGAAPIATQNNLVVPNCFVVTPNMIAQPIGTTGNVINNESGVDGGGVFGVNDRYCVGGYSFFVYTETDESTSPWTTFASIDMPRGLVNLVRPKSNLYGGQSDAAKAATEYMYCGHYQPMDAAFMAYMVGNAGVVDDVEIFGGDAYVSILDVARMIREDNSVVADAVSFASFFACESSLNLSMRQGRHLAKDRSFDQVQPLVNTNGISYSNPTQLEEFVYNSGYSYEESQLVYGAVPLNYLSNNHFRRRVYASPTKIDGELIDSFRIFPVNDFKDLDGVNGDLINLRSKDNRLFYFQQDSFGYLPVFEREVIPNQLGAPVTVGTGGVLERYDDIVNYYGNQHQFGLGETEDAFIWFDARRKELIIAGVGAQVVSLSLAKGLRNEFANIEGFLLLNDNPVRNQGIAIEYNQPLKEMMISFRGIGDTSIVPRNPYAPTGFSVGYDNINKQFTGKFDLLPGIMLEFNNMLIMAHVSDYGPITLNTAYILGDRLTDGTSVYVCILAYTSAGVPVVPSADATHWRKIMDINEVHISDKANVCRFFGYVYDSYATVVVNPEFPEDKVFDTCIIQGSQTFFDTLVAANSIESGTDTAITSSEEYRYIYTSWHFNLPFGSTTGDRLRDKYLTLTFTKDNKLNGQYYQSKNERVKIVSLSTNYRKTY